MTQPLPPLRSDPEVCLRDPSDEALRADSDELPRSLALSQHDYAKAAWFIESLRLPIARGVPFLGTKWAAIRLGPMSLSEWSLALRTGTVTEIPTLTADHLVSALLDPDDAEVRAWAFLFLGTGPAIPDERRAKYLAHPEPELPVRPNTLEGEVPPLSLGRRRWPSRVLGPSENAWDRDE